MPSHIFDLGLIQSATQRAKDYAADTVKRVKRMLVDDREHDRRIQEGWCKWCWYRHATSLAGQMFTEYTCWRCDRSLSHPNTAVPRLCNDCAAATGLCKACCGDVRGDIRQEVP